MARTSPIIRIATLADAAAIAAIYAPSVVGSCTSFELEPPDAREMARRVAAVLPTHPWLVCTEGDTVLGYAYAGAHRARAAYRWSAETSAYVGAEHHRRGVGRALYEALIEILIDQGYQLALAGITLPNEASVGFHESMGFVPVGVYRGVGHKLGVWHDVGWWQRRIRDEVAPAEPAPFATHRSAPSVTASLARAAARIS